MLKFAFRHAERLPALNTEIALMDVANRDESLDRGLQVLRFDHDDQVDHRLRCEARHGRGTDVLYRDCYITDGTSRTTSKPLELGRPHRIGLHDYDRVRHGPSVPTPAVQKVLSSGGFANTGPDQGPHAWAASMAESLA